MTDLRRPWRALPWGGRVLAALAVVTSLVAAVVSVVASGSFQAPLVSTGTPVPVPSTTAATAPRPQSVTPTTGLPAATTLTSVGTNELVALTSTGAAVSSQGRVWVQVPMPPGVSALVVDRADADRLAAGGNRVQTTIDGGRHWTATPAQPVGPGPFVPLLISPWDSRVLFVAHQGQVAVTVDGGSTWHDVEVPVGGQPVMSSGNTAGTFFLAAGSNMYQLTGDGAKVNPRPPLPGGAVATSLAVGRYLLVSSTSSGHLFILKGATWTSAPLTAAGPVAVDGTDVWAVVPAFGANAPEAVEESSDGGTTWQARPGLPAGEGVRSLALSSDARTAYALDSIGDVYESLNRTWYLLSSGLQLSGAGG